MLRGSMDRLIHLSIYKGGAQSENSACTQEEYGQQNVYQGRKYLGLSFSLDVKGGEWLGVVVAIKSKGGDCWHYDTDMNQVLSLMATHSDDRSQFRLTKWRKKGIRKFTIYQVVYTRRFTIYKGTYNVHTHFHKRKGTYMSENYVLVHGILVLVHGIWSEVLTPGIGSKVLVLHGFGPWYSERPKTI